MHHGKHYLRDFYIEGSVNFIFGDAMALLEHCHIHCKAARFVTAQGRRSHDVSTGYVFLRYDHNTVNGVGFFKGLILSCFFSLHLTILMKNQNKLKRK